MDRNVINQLLVATGTDMETASKLATERAVEKLRHRLTKNGVPSGLTPDQLVLVGQLGFAAKADPEEAALPHRLPGADGKPDRVEEITPSKAEFRNGQRDDGRKWEPLTGAELEAYMASKNPQPKAETAPKGDDAKTKAADKPVSTPDKPDKAPAKAKAPSKGKPAPAAKTSAKSKTTTKSKGTKPATVGKTAISANDIAKLAKTVKDAEDGKPPKRPAPGKALQKERAKNAVRATSGSCKHGTIAILKDIMNDGKPHVKAEVIAKLIEAGASKGSASSYMSWIQRDDPGYRNPFNILCQVYRDKATGVKMIKKVKNLSMK